MRISILFLIAAVAASCSFVVHVFTVEWLPLWITDQMAGTNLIPSWDVRYVAGVTSIEYGIAAVVLYLLVREKFVRYGRSVAVLSLFVLLAALHGALIRQPLMDLIIGNPTHVVVVQNLLKMLVWLLMSLVVVLGTEALLSRTESQDS